MKRRDFLSNVKRRDLEEMYHKEMNAKAKIRLQCALLRKEEKTLDEISSVTKKPKSTVGDILVRFERRGVAAKDAVKQIGQPKKLSDAQLKKLKRTVEKEPTKSGFPFVVWTTKLVAHAIKKLFKVLYSLRQVRNLLMKFQLSLQKPRPEHIKANKALQRRFKKNFDEELSGLIHSDMRSSFWTRARSNLNHTSYVDGSRLAQSQPRSTL